jgi:hypothetical protein
MWLILAQYRVYFLVAAGVLALGASSVAGYKLGRAAGDREVAKMYQAGAAVVAKRNELIQKNLESYREELLSVSNRRPKRVLFCPPSKLSPSTGGADGAGAGGVDQHNYEPDLRAARDALIRCNALIHSLGGDP